ncbi:MAG TPA: nitrous oxide-stimulated promoter family protein [Spirochaetota bacterium]|nr:nitrous oxide-stimulated promoter family protein [Spirochaetota bacterium]HSA14801.1 nitrous oxide-stimulated promoter family protein [Spirochaetota bacterium]
MKRFGQKPPGGKIRADIEILAEFVKTRCEDMHPRRSREMVHATGKVGEYVNPLEIRLCAQCRDLLVYGASMRVICPLDPKPACRKCPQPCYRPGYRTQIREVMKYSGRALIKRGRIDLLFKYILH